MSLRIDSRELITVISGERTASALEAKLDGIESRIEELLASIETGSRQPGQASDSAAQK